MLRQKELQGGTTSFGNARILDAHQHSSVERTVAVNNKAVLLGKNTARRVHGRRIGKVTIKQLSSLNMHNIDYKKTKHKSNLK
jgi:hypothetical protein